MFVSRKQARALKFIFCCIVRWKHLQLLLNRTKLNNFELNFQLGNGTAGTDVRVRNNKLHCQNCYSNDEGNFTGLFCESCLGLHELCYVVYKWKMKNPWILYFDIIHAIIFTHFVYLFLKKIPSKNWNKFFFHWLLSH